ncbi:prepilin-type N-terminal cleavage/methylation domain-containing protein [Corallococcus praedator]|uniref:Prepilin-type N-terminal cleavage/methylation domain-containing protein n=2 Tax=Corallococcus TaxID=83461 RepID=A0ABX9QIP0_9BACT|nr:PilW family protein [Corallococcus praedator]RKH12430.1 prepilin-type N-terminal cleavage/methylation domain-containing protein [Corallococcus sp. CA047B]RKH30976.1 prepilin-type N-terminal cleavage/methylation domain-containing protein [Corallococcus sp. CA031C]RKI07005.1 prepilin-type N-terminal cleavage/methylation domain-containing protein [Corallococcus praedator]
MESKAAPRRAMPRGMTLLETMVASALATIILAAAAALLLAGGRVVHNTEHVGDSHDHARLAGEALLSAVRQAGAGMSEGLWVVSAGVPQRINPVFGGDGAGTGLLAATTAGNVPGTEGTDDLWLVVPDRNYLGRDCAPGAAMTVVQPGTGSLQVNCVGTPSSAPAANAMLVASNMKSAALLTQATVVSSPPTATVNYLETGVPGFSNAPHKGGFQRGDLVYTARLLHFFIAPNPATGGRKALMRAEGLPATDASGRPFMDMGDPLVVQDFVEDFQVAFGVDATNSGDPSSYVFQDGLSPEYTPGLRSVRISVVATGRNPRRDTQNQAVLAEDLPIAVENHTPPAGATADGYFRSLFSRRAELPNLASASL